MASKRRSPDADLASENYLGLNTTFYEASPHGYFSERLSNLLLVASKGAALDALIAEGFEFGGLSVPASQSSGVSEEERAKAAEHFVTAETEVLSHHVGETLLRLYLAHEGVPACPWLELSRMRTPTEFKASVRRRFGAETDVPGAKRRAEVAKVFYLTDTREALKPAPSEAAWNTSLDVIEEYLSHFARQHLDQAALYNAAKHGLAVRPSRMSLKWNDGALVSVDGAVMQYLYLRDRDDGLRRWYQGTHWVRRDMQMALISRACQLIEALWVAARFRYVPNTRGAGAESRLFGRPTPSELMMAADERGFVITDMGQELIYYRPVDEPPPGR